MLCSFVLAWSRNLSFLIVHKEWMEFQPKAVQATLLEYHLGICKIRFAISPWKHLSFLMVSSDIIQFSIPYGENTTLHNWASWHWAQASLECIDTAKLKVSFPCFLSPIFNHWQGRYILLPDISKAFCGFHHQDDISKAFFSNSSGSFVEHYYLSHFEAFRVRKLSSVNCVTIEICASRVVEQEAGVQMSSACRYPPA